MLKESTNARLALFFYHVMKALDTLEDLETLAEFINDSLQTIGCIEIQDYQYRFVTVRILLEKAQGVLVDDDNEYKDKILSSLKENYLLCLNTARSLSLSSTDRFTPSACVPSLNVVSKISIIFLI